MSTSSEPQLSDFEVFRLYLMGGGRPLLGSRDVSRKPSHYVARLSSTALSTHVNALVDIDGRIYDVSCSGVWYGDLFLERSLRIWLPMHNFKGYYYFGDDDRIARSKVVIGT